MTATKTCTRCGKAKPLDAFHRCQRYPDGRMPYCKRCQNTASRAGERRRRAEHNAWVERHLAWRAGRTAP